MPTTPHGTTPSPSTSHQYLAPYLFDVCHQDISSLGRPPFFNAPHCDGGSVFWPIELLNSIESGFCSLVASRIALVSACFGYGRRCHSPVPRQMKNLRGQTPRSFLLMVAILLTRRPTIHKSISPFAAIVVSFKSGPRRDHRPSIGSPSLISHSPGRIRSHYQASSIKHALISHTIFDHPVYHQTPPRRVIPFFPGRGYSMLFTISQRDGTQGR